MFCKLLANSETTLFQVSWLITDRAGNIHQFAHWDKWLFWQDKEKFLKFNVFYTLLLPVLFAGHILVLIKLFLWDKRGTTISCEILLNSQFKVPVWMHILVNQWSMSFCSVQFLTLKKVGHSDMFVLSLMVLLDPLILLL